MKVLLLLTLVMMLALPPISRAQSTISTPIGTVTTTTITIDHRNKPAGTVYLYEALPPTVAQRPNAPVRVQVPTFSELVEPALQTSLREAPNSRHSMLIYLADQADLSGAYGISDWSARGDWVYQTLITHAQRSQAPMMQFLRDHGYQARSLWIVNALVVDGDTDLVTLLQPRSDIASITANHRTALAPEPASTPPLDVDANAWGLDTIRAPLVWSDWGVQGANVVVANIDTGVYLTHTALLQNYRGWSAGGISNDYNWYDASATAALPTDNAGHGTHTMGTMVGRKTATTPAIGVAPQARWIAARACIGAFCTESDLISSAEWMLAPTRVGCQKNPAIACNPRPDLRPHIINNSWGGPGENLWFQNYKTAWDAAGIFGIFAAGNYGLQGCQTSTNPGNNAGVFSVGATAPNDVIAGFSSRGPTTNGDLTPDLSAPGVDVPSAWFDGSIHLLSGTSMATPHVAGATALLWSANPTLIGDLAQTQQLLAQHSEPRYSTECGDAANARPNNVYGWGRLDAYASVQAGHVDVPWLSVPATVNVAANTLVNVTITLDARQVAAPGTYTARVLLLDNNQLSAQTIDFVVTPAANTSVIHGTLQDYWNGNGVYGTLSIGNGPTIHSDADGTFMVVLPHGSYSAVARATGYRSESLVVHSPEDSANIGINLVPKIPRIRTQIPPIDAELAFGDQAVFPVTISNDGIEPLHVTAIVPFQDWSVERGQSVPWYDLSAFAALPLKDDMVYTDALDLGFDLPLFGVASDQIYVSSNGWVSTTYQSSGSPGSRCLPSNSLPYHTLAPFWADLDPSQGGAIRAGSIDSSTFVVSYEAVPLWQDAAITTTLAPTYTFQLSFHDDGRVQFAYQSMAALPARWAVGTQTTQHSGQSLACNDQPQSLDGQSWTLRSQANSQIWLNAVSSTLTIAPQQTAVLSATLRGFGYTPWRDDPAQGILKLTSDDPRNPSVDVFATIRVGAPPFSVQLPVVVR